jgi:tetratricopeptide (TPR) repeat protein
MKLTTLALACALLATACAGTTSNATTTPSTSKVEMEELRITATRKGEGYSFDVYDAKDLFERATELLNAQQCRDAVVLYDKVAKEFEGGGYASASLYNAGLCLQALGDFAASAERYAALRERYPASDDRKDATFQLAEVLVQLERWDEIIKVSDELLADEALSAMERLEGMARRSQALLGKAQYEEAEKYARGALSFYRTRPSEDPIRDDFFAAACNYVVAETFRLRAQGMAFPIGLEEQKKVLTRRAELLLEAQREYFNTISLNNLDNYYWAAASGYRIGHMYDELWQAVMTAPVPPNLPPEGHPVYREELAKLIKPLIRHAIRYWELTLMFMERTNIKGAWADKTASDLERVRKLLLEQPEGPGGLQTAPASTSTPSDAPAGSVRAAESEPAPLKPPAPRRGASRPTVAPSPASAAP